MPYGTLVNIEEFLADRGGSMDLTLIAEKSAVEDLKEGVGVGDVVGFHHQHASEDGERVTVIGNLIVEDGDEGKDRLLALMRFKATVDVTIKHEKGQTFPTIQVRGVKYSDEVKAESKREDWGTYAAKDEGGSSDQGNA